MNMASELKRSYFPGFGPRASSSLLKHDWPGNVRELKNTVERSVYRSADPDQPIMKIAFDPFDSPFKLADDRVTTPLERQAARTPLLPADLTQRLRDTERSLLQAALDKSRFNQRLAADLLSLSYDQFRGKLKKHGLSGRASKL